MKTIERIQKDFDLAITNKSLPTAKTFERANIQFAKLTGYALRHAFDLESARKENETLRSDNVALRRVSESMLSTVDSLSKSLDIAKGLLTPEALLEYCRRVLDEIDDV